MKLLSPFSSPLAVTLCLSWFTAGVDAGFAQQASYGQPAQYASSYYPPRQPSVMERIQNTGQNVGNFIRRKFYGESAQASYPQQPVYHRPDNSQPTGYQTQSYSLDAPARPAAGHPQGTGFQHPSPGTTPRYVTPPRPAPSVTAKGTGTKSVSAPPRSSASRSRQSEPAPKPTIAKKRYAPATPSKFSTPKPKPAPDRVRVEDQPPALSSPPARRDPTQQEAPPQEPSTEARLNTETFPSTGYAGGTSAGISPTIGGTELDLTPRNTSSAESKSPATFPDDTRSTSSDSEPKSQGSFLIGKKTSKVGRVVSPYAPYNELDITGLPSGSLALDPTTKKVFQVP